MASRACSSSKDLHTEMAGDSRVSLVSFLKAKPSTARRLPETVLKSVLITRVTNRLFCQSLILTTCSQ